MSLFYNHSSQEYKAGAITVASIIACLALIAFLMWVFPVYGVWQQGLSGKAELEKQEYEKQILVEQGKAELERQQYEKQILIEQAKAEKDAAIFEAQAEVERAKGVAEANAIIGDSLRGNEVYIKWLLADGLKDQDTQLIYVPTEAGLPILEATR